MCKNCQKLKKELNSFKKLALLDPLTELYNYRKLEEDINKFSELNRRHKIKFLITMIDIDNFKLINDSVGHNTGDICLKAIGQLLKHSIRSYDRVYRVYGDEFIIIFSHYKRIDMLLKRIKNKVLNQLGIRISIGTHFIGKNILEKIDREMYRDKLKGD